MSLDLPFPVHSLDSRPLGSGVVREATVPLDMVTQGSHKEQISLFLIDSPAFPVVLGIPWLAQHNPVISWRQGALRGWSVECSGRCIVGATTVEPSLEFIVEVDASEAAVAAVLSQTSGLPPKLRPCAFFSRKLLRGGPGVVGCSQGSEGMETLA